MPDRCARWARLVDIRRGPAGLGDHGRRAGSDVFQVHPVVVHVRPDAVDAAEIYDCYTITVLLTLEDAGFCAKGEGMTFIVSPALSQTTSPVARS